MTTSPRDDYLWDRSGPVDADIAALETTLAVAAWRPVPRRAPVTEQVGTASWARGARARRRWPRRWLAAAAAVLVLVAAAYAGFAHRLAWPDAQPWRIASIVGDVTVDGAPVSGEATRLAPGEVMQTGEEATARLRVARIGEMVLGPASRFSIVATGDGRHRTQLQEGTLWARLWSPPGAFGVSTPAGEVFDRGCEFVLEARADGSGSLRVRSGWVQVDTPWGEVLVPQGARVEMLARGRPGIPHDDGASPAFVAALRDLHAAGRASEADGVQVRALLEAARREDAISLLYLLQFHPHLAGGPVFDRLARDMPSDVPVSRDDVRRRGLQALSPWWDALPYPRIKRWWLQWPDAFASREDDVARLRDDARR